MKLHCSDSLLIGCIYRAPSADITHSTETVYAILQKAATLDSHLLICGDFNYSNIKRSCDQASSTCCGTSQLFLDTFQDLFLFQHIHEPTRYRGDQTPHVLDLVFTNEENMIDNIQYHPGLANSDHVCVIFDLSCYTPTNEDAVQLKYNVRRANFNKLQKLLDKIDWHSGLDCLNVN